MSEAATRTSIVRLSTSELPVRTIAVAIDFSEHSELALDVAIMWARWFDAELLLVHAASPLTYLALEPVQALPPVTGIEIASEKMSELVQTHEQLKRVRHEHLLAYGTATEVMDQVIKERGADLVIAGSRGAGALSRLAIGSTAEGILNTVRCPVVIVGPNCKQERDPFGSILLATDLKQTGLRSAQYASSFAERFHGRLTILHVLEEKEGREPVSERDLVEHRVRQELTLLIPSDFEAYASSETLVEWGKPGQVILEVADSISASLIVTGLATESYLGDHAPFSTLAKIIRMASCPVLGVRPHLI